MARVKSLDPDLVYFGGTVQSKGGQLAKDMFSAGIDAVLLVPDGCQSQTFIESAGAAMLEGRCFVTFGGLPPERLTGKGAAFVERYRREYGESPDGYAVYGYEAAGVVLRAIRDAATKDRRAITAAALAIRDYDGALGRWGFDDNGDTTLGALTVSVVREGRFEFAETITASDMADEPPAE